MKTIKNKIDKSRLFKRAWYLVKMKCFTLSYALITVWAEMKETIKNMIAKLEISKTIQYAGSTWGTSTESMQVYYNSNAYKGD